MKQLFLKPEIYKYSKAKEFAKEFQIGEGDLVISNEFDNFSNGSNDSSVIYE